MSSHAGCSLRIALCNFFTQLRGDSRAGIGLYGLCRKSHCRPMKTTFIGLVEPTESFSIFEHIIVKYSILVCPPLSVAVMKAVGFIKAGRREKREEKKERERWSIVSGGCVGCKCKRDKSSPLGCQRSAGTRQADSLQACSLPGTLSLVVGGSVLSWSSSVYHSSSFSLTCLTCLCN